MAAVSPTVRDHDFIHAECPRQSSKLDQLFTFVEIFEHWPDEVCIIIKEAVVPEVKALKNSMHIISPGVVCY